MSVNYFSNSLTLSKNVLNCSHCLLSHSLYPCFLLFLFLHFHLVGFQEEEIVDECYQSVMFEEKSRSLFCH